LYPIGCKGRETVFNSRSFWRDIDVFCPKDWSIAGNVQSRCLFVLGQRGGDAGRFPLMIFDAATRQGHGNEDVLETPGNAAALPGMSARRFRRGRHRYEEEGLFTSR